MTIHPAIVIIACGIILMLLVAYAGAAVKAAVLQATVDQLWPIVRALGRALDADATKSKGAIPQ